MAFAFDTLGYAKRLRSAGVSNEQAEAHAEAAREFIMAELVTKADLLAVKADVLAVKSDLSAVKADILAVRSDFKADLLALKAELLTVIETQTLRLTVRLGGIVAVGVGVLAAAVGVLAFVLRQH
uniref:DUF1640 domain-containing protein n=1 Tax=Rhodopseudomonas palustris (strain BisA53) TaxID=316055 RepID=Q07N48_RHOP5